MKKLNIKKGFTLIELLVVIAIIAILASILIPVVTSALDDAKIANMRDTGVGLYKSIFAADADDPVFGGNTVIWPSEKDSEQWPDSTEYFKHLVTNDFIEADFSIFSGPGIKRLKDTDELLFTEEFNAWCVTLDVPNQNASLPFLFSRNMDITSLPDGTQDGVLQELIPDAADVSGKTLKFHEKAVVVITKGGSGVIIKKRNLDGNDTVKNFNPTSKQNGVLTPTSAGTSGGDGGGS